MAQAYAAIDLKSFYASVECVARGLDPLTTNLVVADASRTEKTICLAVSPSLKKLGLPGRCRLFEVSEAANAYRRRTGRELEYIVAPPRMQLYMDTSAHIYEKVYLKTLAAEDIHVYSVDEVFMDLGPYLKLYGRSPRRLVSDIIRRVLEETGITATAGIGTNLYLAKVAMDIVAKHQEPDEYGARVAMLDEMEYRRQLWEHQPLTDFWRIGRGISDRLAKHGMTTMGDVARMSLTDEDLLFKLFGVDAELLIDHAWGVETCTMADIHAFRPQSSSVSVGQVLPEPYPFDKGRIIVREMADQLALDLSEKGLVCDSVTLSVIYDQTSLTRGYTGATEIDYYGRTVPKAAHGTQNILDAGGQKTSTSSARRLTEAAAELYDRIARPELTVRRFYLVYNNARPRREAEAQESRQLDMFTDLSAIEREQEAERRDDSIQRAMLEIRQKYGRNAILKGTSYEEGATGRDRNRQIGGHRAGTEE